MSEKTKAVDISDLQEAVFLLNCLLSKPEPGMFSWHSMLNDRVKTLLRLAKHGGFTVEQFEAL